MNYGLYLSAAAMRVGHARMDTVANNLANANTTSFKADATVVASRLSPAQVNNLPSHLVVPVLDDITGGLAPGGTYTDFTQGRLQTTNRTLDVAIQGDGFFSVQTDEGELRYTRDGRFDTDSEDYLILSTNGFRVLDDNGDPIQLPAEPESITASGDIHAGGSIFRLALTDFADRTQLRKAGGNTYQAGDTAEQIAADATVRHRCLEGSGVDPTRSLVDMITAQRTYEASAKMIQYTDSMLSRAVNDIAQIA